MIGERCVVYELVNDRVSGFPRLAFRSAYEERGRAKGEYDAFVDGHALPLFLACWCSVPVTSAGLSKKLGRLHSPERLAEASLARKLAKLERELPLLAGLPEERERAAASAKGVEYYRDRDGVKRELLASSAIGDGELNRTWVSDEWRDILAATDWVAWNDRVRELLFGAPPGESVTVWLEKEGKEMVIPRRTVSCWDAWEQAFVEFGFAGVSIRREASTSGQAAGLGIGQESGTSPQGAGLWDESEVE